MTNKIIKVDRVRTASEAAVLEDLGATMIGVDLALNRRFSDNRTSTIAQAVEIAGALRTATLVAALDLTGEAEQAVADARRVGATQVQPLINVVPPYDVRLALHHAGIGIVYSGIEISHDDYPDWIFTAHDAETELNATLFQTDVLSEYRNAWEFFRDESPEYPEEFQIEDLDELARNRPILVGLDFTPGNIAEILSKLPSIAGITFVLAEEASRTDVHFHSYANALDVLRSLRN